MEQRPFDQIILIILHLRNIKRIVQDLNFKGILNDVIPKNDVMEKTAEMKINKWDNIKLKIFYLEKKKKKT